VRTRFGIAALLLVPALLTAPAVADDDSVRVAPYFILGFGGEVEIPLGPFGSIDADLDPTLGGGVRFEVPLLRFVAVGASVAYAGFLVDAEDAEREHVLDFDAFVKGRFVVSVGPRAAELYALMPLGLSLWIPSDEDADNEVGWNLGVLFGAGLDITANARVFGEIGFLRHDISLDEDLGDLEALQARFHVGVSFAL
jgi:hypothetical protein